MNVSSTPPRLIRAREVAAILGCDIVRVRELVREGRLRSIRFGPNGWHRFDPRDVERFIRGDES